MKLMKLERIVWTIVLAGLAGALALAIEGRRDVQAEGPSDPAVKELAGKKVWVFFRDAHAPYPEFETAYLMEGTAAAVSDTGIVMSTTSQGTNGFTLYVGSDKRDRKVKDSEYKATIFVPWSAVKYVKIVQ